VSSRFFIGKSRVRVPVAVFCLAAAGCSHLKVADLGGGHRSLTAVSPSGGYSGSHEEAIEEANDYCRGSRQAAVIDHFEDQSRIGPKGEHSSRIFFSCAAPQALHF
jgi:hypothetical protein